MKFIKCVIGANYTPVGFVYENNGIERYEDFASLCRRNATDGKLYFSDSGVFGLYNNAENAIDICRETVGGGHSAPIDPSLTLTQRIISGGKVVGFVVKDSTGTEVKKHIASILSASKYMKPANYKVVERNGNQFLQGKGVRLSSLPAIDLAPGLTKTAKPKTVRSEPYDAVDPKLTKGISLVKLTKIVADYHGTILKLVEDKYKPVGENHVADGDGFSRMTNVCEIAPAIINAAANKVSASYKFKVPGTFATCDGPALAFLYRNKNIANVHYKNGVLRTDDVRLGRVIIAIPQDKEQEFYSAIAGTVAVEKIVDHDAITNTAMMLIQMNNPVFLAVDLTEISLLGPEYEDYIMAAEQIKHALVNIRAYKYACNFAKKIIEGVRFTMPANGPTPIWESYRKLGYSDVALNQLKMKGVDISTGTFSPKAETKTANKDAVDKSEDVEISYSLADKDPKLPKEALDVLNMSLANVPQEAQRLVAPIIAAQNLGEKLKLAETLKMTAEHTYKKYEYRLFLHKVAMLLDGNNTVHSHDKTEWASATVRSNAQFIRYTHPCGVVLELRQMTMSN